MPVETNLATHGFRSSKVSTKEFWQLMCRSSAVRLNRNEIVIGVERYYCDTPPEDVPGFIEAKIDGIADALEPSCCISPLARFRAWLAIRKAKQK